MVIKKYLKICGLNIIYFIIGFLLLSSELSSNINPFYIAFWFACFYCFNNIWSYVVGFSTAGIFYEFSLLSVLSTFNILIIMVIIHFIRKRKQTDFKLPIIFPIMLLGSLVKFCFCLNSAETLVLGVINLILQMAFLYAYIIYFRSIITRGMATKFNLDEFLGLCLFVAPLTLALYKLTIFNLNISSIIIPFFILLTISILGGKEALTLAIICGVGISFSSLNFNYLVLWCFYAIIASAVGGAGRWASSLGIIVVDIIMGFYFNIFEVYTFKNIIPLAVVGLVYVLIPQRIINHLKLYFYETTEEMCLNEIVVQEERVLKERLKRVSSLFLEMHQIYKNMVIGSLDEEQVGEIIKTDIIKQNCENCHKYKICYEGRAIANRNILELVKKGISKKKVSLVDVPTTLTQVCGKTNQIIFQLNSRLDEFNKFEKDISGEDESKILMSNQLLGVSEIIEDFGTSFQFGERASKTEENSLINSFLYNDIIVRECAIFKEENCFKRVVLVVKNVGYKKRDVLSVTNMFFKLKTKILDTRYTKVSGWQIVTIVPAPIYSYMVGVAKTSKNERSGDTFSELVLDGERAMFAISDGKGCGTDAEKISKTTINLIENFYQAGFRTEHIIDNVNKVLSYKSGEKFSAVDLFVLDLNMGRVDFVKRGGTPSVIKKANYSLTIEGKDLPIGVIDGGKSSFISYYINSGDCVVIASDGVFDAFNTSENFSGFINNLPAVNMQEFANSILSRAISLNNGKVYDDMTVLAVKVLINR